MIEAIYIRVSDKKIKSDSHETWKCADQELQRQIHCFPYAELSDFPRLQQVEKSRRTTEESRTKFWYILIFSYTMMGESDGGFKGDIPLFPISGIFILLTTIFYKICFWAKNNSNPPTLQCSAPHRMEEDKSQVSQVQVQG